MQLGLLFAWAIGVSGAAAGWLNPVFGLMVYYALAVIRPTSLWHWNWAGDPSPPRFSFWVAISTLLGWAFVGFGRFSALKPVRIPMLGLVLYLIAGTIAWQTTAYSSERAWEFLALQLKIGLMAMITVTLIRNAKQIQAFAWLIVVVLGYLSWDFNYQYYFQGWNRVYWVGFGGIDNNGVAMIMVMGVPLAFFMGFRAPQLWVRILCFAAVLMQIHVILFSFSRGGQLGLCIVAAAILFIALMNLPRKGLTITLGIVALVFGLIFAGAEVRDRFWSIFADQQERDTSAASRFLTWGAAWECIKDNPLGVGPRNFNTVSHLYGLDRNKSVHNLFLQTGADYGVLGMAGLAIFYFGSMWSAFRMALMRTAKRLGWPRYFGHMICIALGGFLICSQFIGVETVEAGFIISLLGLCTVSYVRQEARADASEDSIPELTDMPRHDPHAVSHPA